MYPFNKFTPDDDDDDASFVFLPPDASWVSLPDFPFKQ